MTFDVSSLDFSPQDVKRQLRLPKELDVSLAEEIGIHIGDGSLNRYKGRYLYSLRGHRFDDEAYYRCFVPGLYKRLYNARVHIRTWPDVIGFQLGSKAIGQFKSDTLGLPLGKKGNVGIPSMIFSSKEFLKCFLRGLFDTDGSLYFEKKSKNKPYYPRISISTTSKKLHTQTRDILTDVFGFNLSCWKIEHEQRNWKTLHRICVRGESNLNKWFAIIGSSNQKNIAKYKYWKLHGFCLGSLVVKAFGCYNES